MSDPMKVDEQQIRQAVETLRAQPSYAGSLDFLEFIVDPKNENTQGWPEAAGACYEYLQLLGLGQQEKREALLRMMKEERDKRFTK